MSPKRLLLESKITNPSNSTSGQICKTNILSNEKLSSKDNIENAYSQLIEITPEFWNIVSIQVPSFEDAIIWLKEKGNILEVDF